MNHLKIFLRQPEKVLIAVNSAEIILVQASNGYAKIITTSGFYFLTSPLIELARELPARHFCQVHRSYVVGIDHIRSVTNGVIRLGDIEVPISKSYEPRFLSLIKVVS